jgi:hypothetical protein
MTKRKEPTEKLSPPKVMQGKQYPGASRAKSSIGRVTRSKKAFSTFV